MEIGFLPITLWDLLDVLIVGYLMYRIYKLLRGSIAFNIFIGVIAVYGVWWLVRALDMELLSSILTQFVNVGVIMLIIIFQPEVRRFLLFVGNTTLKGRAGFFNRLFDRQGFSSLDQLILDITAAAKVLAKSKTGALIVISENDNLQGFADSGIVLDAEVSAQLLISIFNKESPLHDGAVIITGNRIKMAGSVLSVSDSLELPQWVGLRHRAGVGVTEETDALVVIVSEESGNISIAKQGRLIRTHTLEDLGDYIRASFSTEQPESKFSIKKILLGE